MATKKEMLRDKGGVPWKTVIARLKAVFIQ